MWILIECDDPITGPGHNEKRRFILSDYLSIVMKPDTVINLIAMGDEVNPCSSEELLKQ